MTANSRANGYCPESSVCSATPAHGPVSVFGDRRL
nr:MAG TPA: hypothetical protein [Caudoviricetes sp.]